MAAVGGSIKNVSMKGRIFPVAADADVSRQLGGTSNEVVFNGDGSARYIKTPTGWMLEGLAISIDHARGDHEYIQEIADRSEPVDISVTYADDVTYSGVGLPTGDLKHSSRNATMPVSFAGEGKFAKQ